MFAQAQSYKNPAYRPTMALLQKAAEIANSFSYNDDDVRSCVEQFIQEMGMLSHHVRHGG